MQLAAETSQPVDPVAEAIESYVEATGGGGESAGFPWVLVVGLLVAFVAVVVMTLVIRRRLG